MRKKDEFYPQWCKQEAPHRSYRSLIKYGDPRGFKYPNRGLFMLLKETLGMRDEDFKKPKLSMEPFDIEIPPSIAEEHINALRLMVGAENLFADTYSRTRASYGAAAIDVLRLRQRIVENISDVVLCPRDPRDVKAIVSYCHEHRIPVYVNGGGSSVTRGKEAVKGGVSLEMSAHLNKVVAFNEANQTVTVQAGIWGPELERILNNAPKTLGARRRYTCGHFPQSFDHSSAGGWVVTRGAGQNSTYYGKIEDMVIAQEYVTPTGVFKTPEYPRSATGPDFDQIMIGSEGIFGILINVTLKVCRYDPENTRRFSFLFKNWEDGRNACREIMQGEFGYPSIFRLSDQEETDVAMHTYHVHGTPVDVLLRWLGYQPMQRCLLLGTSDGDADFTRLVAQKVKRICKGYHAFTLTPFRVTQAWERSRFTDPFIREVLMDYGIMIDTLECAITWSQMAAVHDKVRSFIKSRPHTVCMSHLSHFYPQGANLYFIFIARLEDINEYIALQYGILEAILKAGAAVSHHHGIGKQTGPWFEEQVGKGWVDVIRALRNHFDPNQIMNPGGTLALDMSEEQKEKRWGLRN